MAINWTMFTPYSALLGGALIGLAASLLIILNGRVMGISGILGTLHQAKSGWRYAFVAGVLLAPILYQLSIGMPPILLEANKWQLLIAGVLVGFGTRLGSGCTSGHGICGLSRFSFRSLAAVCTFMAAGFITVFLIRHAI